jgi:hypothetical protein
MPRGFSFVVGADRVLFEFRTRSSRTKTISNINSAKLTVVVGGTLLFRTGPQRQSQCGRGPVPAPSARGLAGGHSFPGWDNDQMTAGARAGAVAVTKSSSASCTRSLRFSECGPPVSPMRRGLLGISPLRLVRGFSFLTQRIVSLRRGPRPPRLDIASEGARAGEPFCLDYSDLRIRSISRADRAVSPST